VGEVNAALAYSLTHINAGWLDVLVGKNQPAPWDCIVIILNSLSTKC